MARQIITMLTDDLDGGEADQTVTFGLDGISYQIDLSGKNGLKLRQAMEPYIQAGSKLGRDGIVRSAGRSAGGSPTNRNENAAIRAWAQQQGYEVNERGRIAVTIVEAYRNRGTATAAAQPARKAPTRNSRKRPTKKATKSAVS
jgi:hypothetical protein